MYVGGRRKGRGEGGERGEERGAGGGRQEGGRGRRGDDLVCSVT
jgi:hypothetical protein